MTYPEIPEKKGKLTGYGVVALILFLVLVMASLSGSGPNFRAARRAKAANTMTEIQTAYLAYYTEYSDWPQTTENAQLIKILEGDNVRGIPFISIKASDLDSQGRLVDPWGTPYQMKLDSDSKIHVTSAGPDKIFGTADDITNH